MVARTKDKTNRRGRRAASRQASDVAKTETPESNGTSGTNKIEKQKLKRRLPQSENSAKRPKWEKQNLDDNSRPRRVKTDEEQKEEMGRTVHLRNLPMDILNNEVDGLMKGFGTIKSIHIVKNKEGKPTGTAFVLYVSQSSARLAIAAEASARKVSLSSKLDNRSRRMKGVPDLSIEGLGFTIRDRRVILAQAVSHDSLGQSKKTGKDMDKEKSKSRKRMDLMQVGFVDPNSPEVPKCDRKLRADAWREKKMKMENPNFVFDALRLNFRNLPRTVDIIQLKRSIRKIISECPKTMTELRNEKKFIIRRFDDYKAKRRILRDDELENLDLLDLDVDETKLLNRVILKISIVRDEEKKSRPGLARTAFQSKGFAFVGFGSHAVARRVVELMNNNDAVFSSHRRPIVDFAIDDLRALHIQSERAKRDQRLAEQSEVKVADQTEVRTSGDFKSRTSGDFKSRTSGDFKSRTSGDFKSRTSGDFKSRTSGDFKPRTSGGARPVVKLPSRKIPRRPFKPGNARKHDKQKNLK